MFAHQNFFNLNPQTKRKIIISSYLTLLTLTNLMSFVLASSSSESAECEKILDYAYRNANSGKSAALIGYMLLGPIGLFAGRKHVSEEKIARNLKDQGICTDYIEEKYHFNHKALEAAKAIKEYEEHRKNIRLEMEARQLEWVAQCYQNYGQDSFSALICKNSGLILLGLVVSGIFIFLHYMENNNNNNNNQDQNRQKNHNRT